ncbi:MAG TPA: hypothetical protein VJT73_21845 [Polyangiaceae bacterium]|nr:hypothetical protein [Polyangiaceae bacterium]
MASRRRFAFLAGAALFGCSFSASADADETLAPLQIEAIDWASIPLTALPPTLEAGKGPPEVSKKSQFAGIEIARVDGPYGKKRLMSKKLRARVHKRKFVEIRPTDSSTSAMFSPVDEVTDFEGETLSQVSCEERGSVAPIRWESLEVGAGDAARLVVRDLWFDAKHCTVGLAAESAVTLKAVAYKDGKPWLFAVRDERGVTLFMPRTTEVTSEAMAGNPLSVRGAFTRVTLPLGRWGAGSVLATLPALSFSATDAAGQAGDGSGPVEVTIELVQTMAEKTPTLVVRSSDPSSMASLEPRE